MWPFHSHTWEKSEVVCFPPLSEDVLRMMLEPNARDKHGYTTIVYVCLTCGKIKAVEVLGDVLMKATPAKGQLVPIKGVGR